MVQASKKNKKIRAVIRIQGYVIKMFSESENAIAMGQKARLHALKTHNRMTNVEQLLAVYQEMIEF